MHSFFRGMCVLLFPLLQCFTAPLMCAHAGVVFCLNSQDCNMNLITIIRPMWNINRAEPGQQEGRVNVFLFCRSDTDMQTDRCTHIHTDCDKQVRLKPQNEIRQAMDWWHSSHFNMAEQERRL